jgi:hypothetical protein
MTSGLARRLLEACASLRLALLLIVVLALAILLAYHNAINGTWALALPLALSALNLLAAVIVRPGFRRQRALLLFHLGLIAIVLLLACGRLTYLRGTVEVAEGADFDGQLTSQDAGPWHPWHLGQVHFTNDGFEIAYAPGIERDRTHNFLTVPDADGHAAHVEIGDQTPLVQHGYRFYTSPNKGYAPTFVWYPADGGPPAMGAVHLPSYPIHQYQQSREWVLPGTRVIMWTMLSFDELILDPARPSAFRLPQKYELVLRHDGQRHVLRPGEALQLPQGRLVYDGLRTWMGYTVFYDWTTGPLLAACLLSVIALGWHLWQKFAARPWQLENNP